MNDSRAPEVRDLGQVTFHVDGPLGIVTLNRPQVLNAQGYELLAQVDQAFDLAQADQAIRVVIVRGAGGVFSAGHDLSPGQQRAGDPLERYDEFKKYNLDLLLKWRDFPKPTIAMGLPVESPRVRCGKAETSALTKASCGVFISAASATKLTLAACGAAPAVVKASLARLCGGKRPEKGYLSCPLRRYVGLSPAVRRRGYE